MSGDTKARILGTCLAPNPAAPFTSLQGILDKVVEMAKEYGVEHRQDIEEWADDAVKGLIEVVPSALMRVLLNQVAPKAVDAMLDQILCPDNDAI